MLSMTDGAGTKTVYGYDGMNRVVSTAVYDNQNTLISLTSNNYDKDGMLASSTDANGNVTAYTRDKDGNVLYSTVKDSLGNLVYKSGSAANPDTYDPNNDPLTVTDGAGNIFTDTYNADNNPTLHKETDSVGAVINQTSFGYDLAGNQTTSTNGDNNVTSNTYDGDNRPLTTTTKDTAGAIVSSLTYGYDNAGNVVKTTDGNGRVTNYTYDGNRLTLQQVMSGTTVVRNR
jgi:YD repeat-containing protein